jgi:menaquinone-dependent protoporphyrinogen IX oxidase
LKGPSPGPYPHPEKEAKMTHILVGYETHHGPTKEVAEVIAITMRSNDLNMDLQQLRDVRSIEGYHAIVM